jgi:glycosyltransferase involved in cell wall biosynthesis
MQQKVIIIGSAWPLRGGGIATFNERLARAFQAAGDEVSIYSFSLQYPSFLFPGSSQYGNEPKPTDLNIKTCINSINPFNWLRVGMAIRREKADLVVVRYWLPFMGPCLGTILRLIRGNKHSKIVCIADNVIPHEKRPGDRWFTRYFIKPVDAFITMSEKVMQDLRLFTQKPARMVVHPLYDNFGEPVTKTEARQHLQLPETGPIILFFGFIRAYKGLDLLLEALYLLKQKNGSTPKLLIAGEFYEDRSTYDELIRQYQLADDLYLHTDFIPDSEVRYYLCAADFIIQPYKHATQSGITPLAYHFDKPMLVTRVGALAEMVPHEKVGWVAEPNAASIAAGIEQLYALGETSFFPHLRVEKKKYSWDQLLRTIRELVAG